MNRENLLIIIENYINQFDMLKANETYKWVAVQHFQRHWNIEAANFGDMFKTAVSATYNMINNRFVSPTSGIVELAKYDNDKAREMFNDLFSDDRGDIVSRQNRIDEFVSRANDMLDKKAAGKWKFKQDVRTAISYLSLRYPDENYFYKATPAHTFAKYVDFSNDIGGGRHFKLANYYQLCDQIAEVVSHQQALVDLNSTRFNETTWPDKKNHLLVSDIIYCAVSYTLFGDIPPPTTSKKKQVDRSKSEKKKLLKSEIIRLESDLQVIQEMKEDLGEIDLIGIEVNHKRFGCGVIIAIDKQIITVKFGSKFKRLGLPEALTNKSTSIESPKIKYYYEQLAELDSDERNLQRSKILAEAEFKSI